MVKLMLGFASLSKPAVLDGSLLPHYSLGETQGHPSRHRMHRDVIQAQVGRVDWMR